LDLKAERKDYKVKTCGTRKGERRIEEKRRKNHDDGRRSISTLVFVSYLLKISKGVMRFVWLKKFFQSEFGKVGIC
jgi:hypothetical protein